MQAGQRKDVHRREKEGFSKTQSQEGKTRQGRREQGWGRRDRCLPFIWIFKMTDLVPGKPLFLPDREALQAGEGSAVR